MIILDEQEYRNFPALNYSSAKHLLKSQKHFLAEKSKKFEPSREMVIGTLVHAPILEGKNAPFVVKPQDMSFTTKEGKSWRDANKGVEILSWDEHATLKRTVAAIQGNADAMYLLNRCPNREVGIVTEYRGVKIKARLDAYGTDESGNPIIVDLKTTSDANPETWGAHASKLRYFAQMALYKIALSMELKLETPPAWFWICAETNEAADVVIYQPPAEAIEIGQKQLDIIIDRYKDLQETGKAKGYPSGIIELDVPIYEKRKYNL